MSNCGDHSSRISSLMVKSNLRFIKSDYPWLHTEDALAVPVDFSRKRTAFFITGAIHIEDIFWILERISPCSRLIVHQWVDRSALHANSWANVLPVQEKISDKRLFWSIDSDLGDSIQGVLKFMDKDLMDSWQPVLSKAHLAANSESTMTVIRNLGEALNIDNLGRNTKLLITANVLKNALINLPRANVKNSLSGYLAQQKGIPTVIVSSGPSLTKQLDLLFAYQDYLHIVAVDSIFELLTSKGIIPDALIALDPLSEPRWTDQEWPIYTRLFADIGCDPELVNSLSSEITLTFHHPDIGRILHRFGGQSEFLLTGGSVATSGFTLALRLESNPIILIGQDLALTGGQDHAPGYAYPYSENTLNDRFSMGFDIDGYYGDRIRTERQLLFYKNWLEERIKQLPASILIINSTEGGAKIQGSLQIPFADVCQEIRASGVRKQKQAIKPHFFDSDHISTIIYRLEQSIEAISELKSLALTGRDFVKKSGKKNYTKLVKKIDSINHQIKNFDHEIKSLIDIFAVIRLEIIRKDIKRFDKTENKEVTALEKYLEIYETIISNSDYLQSKLLALKKYYHILLKENKTFMPELAKEIWAPSDI